MDIRLDCSNLKKERTNKVRSLRWRWYPLLILLFPHWLSASIFLETRRNPQPGTTKTRRWSCSRLRNELFKIYANRTNFNRNRYSSHISDVDTWTKNMLLKDRLIYNTISATIGPTLRALFSSKDGHSFPFDRVARLRVPLSAQNKRHTFATKFWNVCKGTSRTLYSSTV